VKRSAPFVLTAETLSQGQRVSVEVRGMSQQIRDSNLQRHISGTGKSRGAGDRCDVGNGEGSADSVGQAAGTGGQLLAARRINAQIGEAHGSVARVGSDAKSRRSLQRAGA